VRLSKTFSDKNHEATARQWAKSRRCGLIIIYGFGEKGFCIPQSAVLV